MKKLVLQEKNNNKKEKLTLNVDHAGHWGIEFLQEHQHQGGRGVARGGPGVPVTPPW